MMKNIFVIIFSFLVYIGYSQQQECGTYTSPEDMEVFYNRVRVPENSLKSGNVVEVPVVYHLTRRDDGTGGFDLAETFRLHCDLNERFEDAEIHFYILDIEEHNNTGYFEMNYNGAGSAMMNNENNPNACNVFIVEDAKSGNTSVCGYSFLASGWGGPNRGGVVLDIGCSGPNSTTLTHEMGHYLNLPHTFYGWEGRDYTLNPIGQNQWERADGSNCNWSGDGFCDTPPDYISDRWACTFPRTFDDAIGDNFQVDQKNYMSYSLDGCQTYFKQQQMDEMKNTPSTHRSYLSNLTPPNTDPLVIQSLTFPPNNVAGLTLGPVDFTWDAVPTATYYQFQISTNNFNSFIVDELLTTNTFNYANLTGSTFYKWRVKPISYTSVCNEFVEGSFTMSSFTSSVTVDDVFCFGAADGNAYAVTDDANVVSYKWYSLNSATGFFSNFSTTSTNVVHNLSPNNYYVELVKSNGDVSIVPFDIVQPGNLFVELSQNSNSVISTVTGGTAPYSYLWSDGSSDPINNSPIVGANTIYITDANGCFFSRSHNFTTEVSSINDLSNSITNLLVYPNPVKGDRVFVDFIAKENSAVSLQFFSVEGRLIQDFNKTIELGDNTLSLPVSSLSKGVYILKFSIDNKSITKKVII